MGQSTFPSKKSRDPAEDLVLAIEKLKKFTQENEVDTPKDPGLPSEEESLAKSLSNTLNRTIYLARCFIKTTFSSKSRERHERRKEQVKTDVLRAIEVVKSNYLLIQKLKKGTPEQQKLAATAMEAVQRYNTTLAEARRLPPTWTTRISRYVYESCGLSNDPVLEVHPIDMPQPASVHVEYSKDKKTLKVSQKLETVPSSQKIANLVQRQQETNSEEPISINEADAFRAKAVSLLHNHGIRFTSASEEFTSIRTTPIQASLQTQENQDKARKSRLLLKQIISPFPGEVIEFKGEFQRIDDAVSRSVPVSESFKISSKAHQTGFPHPSQHHGWALSDLLIPPCPQRFDLLDDFYLIYQEKQRIAQALLPEGELNRKAKDLLKDKKQVFEDNRVEMLKKHQTLALTILRAAPSDVHESKAEDVITAFFEHVKSIPQSYDYLSEVQEIVLTNFVTRPFERLKDEWLELKNPKFFQENFKERQKAALDLLSHEMLCAEKDLQEQKKRFDALSTEVAFNYILLMGRLLALPVKCMIAQHMSETIGFTPPMFGEYELKMQASLYYQLKSFHEEFKAEKVTLEMMRERLDTDIKIFGIESFENLDERLTLLVDELEVYFNSRYYTLSSRVPSS